MIPFAQDMGTRETDHFNPVYQTMVFGHPIYLYILYGGKCGTDGPLGSTNDLLDGSADLLPLRRELSTKKNKKKTQVLYELRNDSIRRGCRSKRFVNLSHKNNRLEKGHRRHFLSTWWGAMGKPLKEKKENKQREKSALFEEWRFQKRKKKKESRTFSWQMRRLIGSLVDRHSNHSAKVNYLTPQRLRCIRLCDLSLSPRQQQRLLGMRRAVKPEWRTTSTSK